MKVFDLHCDTLSELRRAEVRNCFSRFCVRSGDSMVLLSVTVGLLVT